MGDPGPEGGVPGRGVQDSVGHGRGRWRRWILLDFDLGNMVIILTVLLGLDLGQFDLLPGLGDWGAQVNGLCGRGCAGYLAGVLWRSEGVPVLGLSEVPYLEVGAPVVAGGDRGKGEEGLSRGGRGDATVGGLVVEEARVRQDAVEGRRGTKTFLDQSLGGRGAPAEVIRSGLALRPLGSLRHVPTS